MSTTGSRRAGNAAGRSAAPGGRVLLWLALVEELHRAEPDMAAVLEQNDKGVVLQERFEFPEASAAFQKVVEMAPDWLPGRINYAIALLNDAQPDTIKRAIQQLEFVLSKDPDNPYGHFCLGMILEYHRHFPDAIPHYEAVTRIDPTDAGAWFRLGYVLEQNDAPPERVQECYETAQRLNPYMRATMNALFRKLAPGPSKVMMEEMERLNNHEVSESISTKYTEQGSKYAQVIGKPPASLPTSAAAPLPTFQPAAGWQVKLAPRARWATAADFGTGPVADLRRALRKRFGATIVRLDFNRDGKPDLLLLGALVENGQVRDLLLRNDGGGVFTDVTASAGLGGSWPSLGCCVGDFDNDGFPDLFIAGAGVQKLFRNKGDGTFADVTAEAELHKLTSVCLGCTWVDLEQDGDLDLLVARCADTPEQALAQLGGAPASSGGMAVFLNVGEAPPPSAIGCRRCQSSSNAIPNLKSSLP